MKNCYTYACDVAKRFGNRLPDIGEIIAGVEWCVRKATKETGSDSNWTDTVPHKGVLLLMGPAPDKLHHCGVVVLENPILIEHALKGRVYTHSLADLTRMGYACHRFLAYGIR